jgi:hypothetical protein
VKLAIDSVRLLGYAEKIPLLSADNLHRTVSRQLNRIEKYCDVPGNPFDVAALLQTVIDPHQ